MWLDMIESQILPFPIDFDGRPYNSLTLVSARYPQGPLSPMNVIPKDPCPMSAIPEGK